MLERPRGGERAVLVHVEFSASDAQQTREDLAEFYELVASSGVDRCNCLTAARDRPDPGLFLGRGKADELKERVAQAQADVVIVNHQLSAAQERNLERFLQCRVVDRIGLILDLFAQRAMSFEGKLQVELAQLRHLSSRLVRGWSHLERQKGGIGLRGPGEKQLETDRRLVTERIKHINRRLVRVSRRRELNRRGRARASLPVVSLVGYTNVGKSTLFNRLTGGGALTADRLFATLDPTLRQVQLPGVGTAILADTVGFIRHLPHDLIAAFRATLEETRQADLLLHVIDSNDSERSAKREQVNEVLREIDAHEKPQIEVFNKLDVQDQSSPRIDCDASGNVVRVWLSAKTGAGVSLMREALCRHFERQTVHRRVRLPPGSGRLRARLYELGRVLSEHPGHNGDWVMEVDIQPIYLDRLCHNEGLDRAHVAV